MTNVNRFWQDAAGVFETATAVADGSVTHLAILVDERNGLRIMDSSGWTLDALRREYNPTAAYTVTRTGSSVLVEGRNATESCSFQKISPQHLLRSRSGVIPNHLLQTSFLTQ